MPEDKPKPKTWKREVAVAVLAAYAASYGWALWALTFIDAQNAASMVSLVNGAGIPVMAFAAAAFGLDSVAKQIRPPREY